MTAAAPLVSVVMPFLDGIRFLPEAIDSVVTQTYPEWELLLVDDGSTDGSSALARDYARGRPDRIRYLEHAGHANRGKSTSRNLGIAEARGELLAFLDADDIFLPDKLARQVDLLHQHADAVMVYGNTEYWVSWNPDRPVLQRDRLGRLGRGDRLRLPAAAIAREPGCASPASCRASARCSRDERRRWPAAGSTNPSRTCTRTRCSSRRWCWRGRCWWSRAAASGIASTPGRLLRERSRTGGTTRPDRTSRGGLSCSGSQAT